MIPFNEMDVRLKKLGKDRAWLSQVSGRKPDSIRVALAKNAPAAKRSILIQKALSDAIELETAAQKKPAPEANLSNSIILTVAPEKYALWDGAAKAEQADTTADWAVEKLNAAAEEWAKSRELHLYAADGENLPSPRSKPQR